MKAIMKTILHNDTLIHHSYQKISNNYFYEQTINAVHTLSNDIAGFDLK